MKGYDMGTNEYEMQALLANLKFLYEPGIEVVTLYRGGSHQAVAVSLHPSNNTTCTKYLHGSPQGSVKKAILDLLKESEKELSKLFSTNGNTIPFEGEMVQILDLGCGQRPDSSAGSSLQSDFVVIATPESTLPDDTVRDESIEDHAPVEEYPPPEAPVDVSLSFNEVPTAVITEPGVFHNEPEPTPEKVETADFDLFGWVLRKKDKKKQKAVHICDEIPVDASAEAETCHVGEELCRPIEDAPCNTDEERYAITEPCDIEQETSSAEVEACPKEEACVIECTAEEPPVTELLEEDLRCGFFSFEAKGKKSSKDAIIETPEEKITEPEPIFPAEEALVPTKKVKRSKKSKKSIIEEPPVTEELPEAMEVGALEPSWLDRGKKVGEIAVAEVEKSDEVTPDPEPLVFCKKDKKGSKKSTIILEEELKGGPVPVLENPWLVPWGATTKSKKERGNGIEAHSELLLEPEFKTVEGVDLEHAPVPATKIKEDKESNKDFVADIIEEELPEPGQVSKTKAGLEGVLEILTTVTIAETWGKKEKKEKEEKKEKKEEKEEKEKKEKKEKKEVKENKKKGEKSRKEVVKITEDNFLKPELTPQTEPAIEESVPLGTKTSEEEKECFSFEIADLIPDPPALPSEPELVTKDTQVLKIKGKGKKKLVEVFDDLVLDPGLVAVEDKKKLVEVFDDLVLDPGLVVVEDTPVLKIKKKKKAVKVVDDTNELALEPEPEPEPEPRPVVDLDIPITPTKEETANSSVPMPDCGELARSKPLEKIRKARKKVPKSPVTLEPSAEKLETLPALEPEMHSDSAAAAESLPQETPTETAPRVIQVPAPPSSGHPVIFTIQFPDEINSKPLQAMITLADDTRTAILDAVHSYLDLKSSLAGRKGQRRLEIKSGVGRHGDVDLSTLGETMWPEYLEYFRQYTKLPELTVDCFYV